ncbi:peptidoglycan DD-metalloendopeptidase family protein [Alkalimonas mucilaginosa]|uniref:Peptidoglycan DD-metalloendopeptidase family protein n=1 Tax=Alkalimonas mucilaginosa TaxID=3057676 RepID=A0ABU7JHZ2_9GAMM|nr:peptidoglycan DD-metalloendopeptidase family protein [Alkalimonas sp. MEB004]
MQTLVSRLPLAHRLFIVGLILLSVLVILLPTETTGSKQSSSEVAELNELYIPELLPLDTSLSAATDVPPLLEPVPETLPEPELAWHSITVQSGDALSNLFRRANVSQQTMLAILALGDSTRTLTRLFPGETLEFGLDETGQLQELRYAINRLESLLVYRNHEGRFQAEQQRRTVEARTEYAAATIQSSFWHAGLSAGLSNNQIMALASIFGWDIDFALDIRAGDSFTVLFERNYSEDEFIGHGAILAAQFSNQGRVIQAVRHSDGHYYKPDGTSMRQAFLRAPVEFTRISSNFNPRRQHPVTGRVAPHNGIDYVAPVGTPIMATGDGRVTASTYNNLNGNYVFIQHGNNIITKYLHLSRRQVKVGDRVRQGQVIGRLGATGRVTGPHLHYEFVVNGVHRNPRTVQLPQAQALTGADKTSFIAKASEVLAELQSQQQQLLAAVP